MAYKLLTWNGDTVRVPLTVINNLNNGREDHFRVALYILATGETDPLQLQQALELKSEAAARHALAFWHGAGLLEEVGEQHVTQLDQPKPRLTTREIALHSSQNPEIAILMQEAQRIFGEVISEGGCSMLAGMYINDKMPLDYLLIGLAHFVEQGFTSQKIAVIRRRLQSWQTQGVVTTQQLEEYLQLLGQRQLNYGEVAEMLHIKPELFTAAERHKIDVWYEQFHYSEAMIRFAVDMTGGGEKCNVNYVNGILKKWRAKGYRQPRDVQAEQQGSNVMPVGRTAAPTAENARPRRILVPKFQLDED